MRERVTVVLDDPVKLLGQSGGFVCEVKVHGPDMGSRSLGTKAGARLPIIGSPVEMIALPLVISGKPEVLSFAECSKGGEVSLPPSS
jgi:hypothetical protein